MAPAERRLIGTGAAAAELGIDPATLWRWERRGLVTPETRTLGGQARWDLEKLRQQVAEHLASADGEGDQPAPGA